MQPVDLDAVDLRRAERVAVGAVLDLHGAERRRDEDVVGAEHALERVVDLGAHLLIGDLLEHGHVLRSRRPSAGTRAGSRRGGRRAGRSRRPCMRSKATFESGMISRHQRSESSRWSRLMPSLTSSTTAPASLNASTASRDDLRDARIDREDVEVGAVGDAHALDRAARRREEVDVLVEAVGVARVVAGERVQHERRVLDRARERALVDERVRAREGVGPHDHRHAAERRLVAVDAAPGRRDADRAAAVGALRERHEAVGDRRRAAAGGAAGVHGRCRTGCGRRRRGSCRRRRGSPSPGCSSCRSGSRRPSRRARRRRSRRRSRDP